MKPIVILSRREYCENMERHAAEQTQILRFNHARMINRLIDLALTAESRGDLITPGEVFRAIEFKSPIPMPNPSPTQMREDDDE